MKAVNILRGMFRSFFLPLYFSQLSLSPHFPPFETNTHLEILFKLSSSKSSTFDKSANGNDLH